MPVPSPIGRRQTVAALLTLTGVTGLVDAVSYLRLGHVFVANMTGNVVFLGFGVASHTGLSPATSGVAIAAFLVGAVGGGRAAVRFAAHTASWLMKAFVGEAALLALAAILTALGVLGFHGGTRYAVIVILAVALGVQNSTVRHLGVPDLTTTVLTLALTGFGADSPLGDGSGSRWHRRLGSVVVMLAGAAAGALLLQVSASAVVGIAALLAAGVAVAFRSGIGAPAAGPARAA